MKRNFNCVIVGILLLLFSAPSFAQKGAIEGYVLTHEHPTAGMSFGGNYAFAGTPENYVQGIMEVGYDGECSGCRLGVSCDHGAVKGELGQTFLGRDMGRHSPFAGPRHNSFSHMRYATDWTKEAFLPTQESLRDSRMRVMVAFALETESLCEQLFYANEDKGGDGDDGFACSTGDSFDSIIRQLDAIKAWVERNNDWMGIAESAQDIRNLVATDKLAIILGVEAEYAFGSEADDSDPVERLDEYYEEGVRTFYLAHKINNRLTGADIFLQKSDQGGRAIRTSQALAGCFYYDDNVGDFPLKGRLGKRLCDNEGRCGANAFKGGNPTDTCSYKLSDISEVNMARYVVKYGGDRFNGFQLYPLPPGFTQDAMPIEPRNRAGSVVDSRGIERNNLGLSHDGERVVRAAMRKGMIVNLDHISTKARKHVHHIATEVFDNYPLNALHNKPNELLPNSSKYEQHEYDFDRSELEMISESGGFFGLRVGPTDSVEYPASGVTQDCPKTSTETAKMLAWLIDQNLNIGYSLDFATITQAVHSRTLAKCGQNLGPDPLHQYDDYLAEGLTHIGMMRNWHTELAEIGLANRYLNELKRDGAEQFVQMWERSEAAAATGTQIDRRIFSDNPTSACQNDADCGENFYCNKRPFKANRCLADGTTEVGESCIKNNECSTGKCQGNGAKRQCVCDEDSDCADNQFCNERLAQNRCLADATLLVGESCDKNSECSSNKCQGSGAARQCVCDGNTDCGAGEYCNNRLGKNRCLVNGSALLGQACFKNDECATGKCQGSGAARQCVCDIDSDCATGQFCNNRANKNRCLADDASAPLGQSCDRNSECASNKCQGSGSARQCVCSGDADCSGEATCKKPAGRKNYCELPTTSNLSIGQSCSTNTQCTSGKCQGSGANRACACDRNTDCNSGFYCNKRAGKNRCLVDSTKQIGQSCRKNDECETGKCQGTGSNRACVCDRDSDCASNNCKKPAGRKNYCKS